MPPSFQCRTGTRKQGLPALPSSPRKRCKLTGNWPTAGYMKIQIIGEDVSAPVTVRVSASGSLLGHRRLRILVLANMAHGFEESPDNSPKDVDPCINPFYMVQDPYMKALSTPTIAEAIPGTSVPGSWPPSLSRGCDVCTLSGLESSEGAQEEGRRLSVESEPAGLVVLEVLSSTSPENQSQEPHFGASQRAHIKSPGCGVLCILRFREDLSGTAVPCPAKVQVHPGRRWLCK